MRTDRLLWIFCIVVLVLMSIKVLSDATEMDCDKCTTELKNTVAGSDTQYIYHNISIEKLVKAQEEGECLFIWDPVQGYVNNGYR